MGAIEAVLLDIDGVLVVSWEPLPGARETISWLREQHMPFRLVTNTTTLSRASLAARLTDAGFDVQPEDLVTAPVATAAYLRAKHPGARCFLLAKGDVADDLEGVELADAGADVVVIAGAEEQFTYDNLNRAYGMLVDGAALVAMHRNTSWMTAEGPKLDAGPYIRALEDAAGVDAVIVGKPSADFFGAALDVLGADAATTAMVGDDIVNDVLAAQECGLTGFLVRTGKFSAEALEHSSARPDHVIDSIAELRAHLA